MKKYLILLLFPLMAFAVQFSDQYWALDGILGLKERASSPSPATAWGKVFTKSADNKLYFLSSTGTEYNILMGAGGLESWETARVYSIDDVVWEGTTNMIYRAIADHTSNVFATDIANWQAISGGGGLNKWDTAISYLVDDVIWEDSTKSLYRANTAHISNIFATDIANWDRLSTPSIPTSNGTEDIGSIIHTWREGFINKITITSNTDKLTSFIGSPTAATTIYTLPPADGTSGQALVTDASGNLSWSTIAGTGANTALSNLAAVAINTSLLSDTNNTDDLGTIGIGWREGFINKLSMDSNGQTTSLQGSSAATASVVYSLPPADGTSGQALVTDSSGNLSWSTIAGTGANTALSNLAAVAINTSLLSDTNNTDDLGTIGIGWREGFINKISMDSNGQTTSLQGSASATASVVYSMPPADGTSGQVLSTNASGILSWVSQSSFTDLWTLNGSDIYRLSNVGIGVTNPATSLVVKDQININGATSGAVGLKAAAAAGSTIYTLPIADGDAGNVIKTDGAGNLSFGQDEGYGITNYIKNPTVDLNDSNVTDTSSIASRNTTTPLKGAGDLLINSTASAENVDFTTNAFANSLKGQNCEATLNYKGDASLYKMQVVSNTTVVQEITLGNFADGMKATINFPCGDLTYTPFIRIASQGDGAAINVDNVYLGEARNVSPVQMGGQLLGKITWAPTTNCSWSKGAASWSNFSADTECDDNARVIVGNIIDSSAGQRPAFGFSSLLAGNYKVVFEGAFEVVGGATPISYIRIFDGTNQYGNPVNLTASGAVIVPSFEISFTLANNLGATTFDVQTYNAAGSFYLDAPTTGFVVSVYYYPPTNNNFQTVNTDNSIRVWGGAHDTDCSWSTTSTSLADPTGDASCTLTEYKNKNFWTISSIVDGTGKQPGITFTPTQTGSIRICAKSNYLYVNQINVNAEFALYEGTTRLTTNMTPAASQDARVYANAGACFTDVATTLAVKNYKFKIRTQDGSYSANMASMNWSVEFIPDFQLPPIVGSVSTNGAAVTRYEHARINNDGSCSVTSQSGSWISSVSHPATGACQINIASGVFSKPPSCTCSIEHSVFTGIFCQFITVPTTSIVTVGTLNIYGTAEDNRDTTIHCSADRGSL